MPLTKSDAETVAYILTKKGKHRASQPFSGELVNFLTKNNDGKYYFLSEDYKESYLVPTGDKHHPYKLDVVSEDPTVIARVDEVNDELLKVNFS